jgi:hypothetical protein
MTIVAIITLLAAVSGMLLGAPTELVRALLAIGGVLAVLQLIIIGANRLTVADLERSEYAYGRRRVAGRREK